MIITTNACLRKEEESCIQTSTTTTQGGAESIARTIWSCSHQGMRNQEGICNGLIGISANAKAIVSADALHLLGWTRVMTYSDQGPFY